MIIPMRCPVCVAQGTVGLWIVDGTFGQPEKVDDSDYRREQGSHRIITSLSPKRHRDAPIEFCLYGSEDELRPIANKWGRYLLLRCTFCGDSATRRISKLK